MMNEIKLFKELVAIKLKDWRVIATDMPLQTVAEMLNSKEFILIGDIGVSKYEVRSFEKFKPTEVDCFIYTQPKQIASILEEIVAERKSKNLKISWTKHLWEMYLNRIWENLNN